MEREVMILNLAYVIYSILMGDVVASYGVLNIPTRVSVTASLCRHQYYIYVVLRRYLCQAVN